MWFRRALPWLFVVAVAAGLFELASVTILPWKASLGSTWAHTSTPFLYRATAVAGPSRAAGIEVGDIMDTREGNNAAPRVAGVPFTLIAHRGAQTVRATIVPVRIPITWDQVVRLAVVFWVLIFALLIYLKGVSVKENDYLILTLVLLTIQSSVARTPLPDARLQLLYFCVGTLVFVFMIVALAAYGLQFRAQVSRSQQPLFYTAIAVSALGGLVNIIGNANQTVATLIDPRYGIFPLVDGLLLFTFPLLFALLTIAAAIPQALPSERQRLAWVAAAFVPYLLGVTLAFSLAGPIWIAIHNTSLFVIPAALTYAALSRRLFDVGFVLNRAAVFAGVSTIVVGAFVLAEWALSEWLRDAGHVENLAASGVLALGLGWSVRFVHMRVDRFVDKAFFRKRHEDATALRAFAREAAYVTDAQTLLERTRLTILAHSDASSVEILTPTGAQRNDPAVLAMLASQDAVDLHKYDTELHGDYAFPMLAHGAFLGVLVCGEKRNGERYAPDEIDALKTLAHGVGLAFDVLSMHAPGDALDAIRSSLDALGTAIAQMPAAIARELRAASVE